MKQACRHNQPYVCREHHCQVDSGVCERTLVSNPTPFAPKARPQRAAEAHTSAKSTKHHRIPNNTTTLVTGWPHVGPLPGQHPCWLQLCRSKWPDVALHVLLIRIFTDNFTRSQTLYEFWPKAGSWPLAADHCRRCGMGVPGPNTPKGRINGGGGDQG
jgi:hypothetical protein